MKLINKNVDSERVAWQRTAMRYDEFRRQLGKAGLSTKEFAALVKVNPCSLSNYSRSGEIPSHWAVVAALMGEMAENGLDFRAVLQRIDITPKRSRGAAADGCFGGRRAAPDATNP